MPWPVYSETFVRSIAADLWTAYTVPAGYRAVVKFVSVTNPASGSPVIHVEVAQTHLIYIALQVASPQLHQACFAVAYSGQVIRALSVGIRADINVSGYLLRDPVTAMSDPPEVTRERLEEAAPLPAGA